MIEIQFTCETDDANPPESSDTKFGNLVENMEKLAQSIHTSIFTIDKKVIGKLYSEGLQTVYLRLHVLEANTEETKTYLCFQNQMNVAVSERPRIQTIRTIIFNDIITFENILSEDINV